MMPRRSYDWLGWPQSASGLCFSNAPSGWVHTGCLCGWQKSLKKISEKKSRLWPVFLQQFHIKAHKEGGSILSTSGKGAPLLAARGGHPKGFSCPRRWLTAPGAEEASISGAVCLHTCNLPVICLHGTPLRKLCSTVMGRSSKYSVAKQYRIVRHHPVQDGVASQYFIVHCRVV